MTKIPDHPSRIPDDQLPDRIQDTSPSAGAPSTDPLSGQEVAQPKTTFPDSFSPAADGTTHLFRELFTPGMPADPSGGNEGMNPSPAMREEMSTRLTQAHVTGHSRSSARTGLDMDSGAGIRQHPGGVELQARESASTLVASFRTAVSETERPAVFWQARSDDLARIATDLGNAGNPAKSGAGFDPQRLEDALQQLPDFMNQFASDSRVGVLFGVFQNSVRAVNEDRRHFMEELSTLNQRDQALSAEIANLHSQAAQLAPVAGAGGESGSRGAESKGILTRRSPGDLPHDPEIVRHSSGLGPGTASGEETSAGAPLAKKIATATQERQEIHNLQRNAAASCENADRTLGALIDTASGLVRAMGEAISPHLRHRD